MGEVPLYRAGGGAYLGLVYDCDDILIYDRDDILIWAALSGGGGCPPGAGIRF